jgi:hypothetical protein
MPKKDGLKRCEELSWIQSWFLSPSRTSGFPVPVDLQSVGYNISEYIWIHYTVWPGASGTNNYGQLAKLVLLSQSLTHHNFESRGGHNIQNRET